MNKFQVPLGSHKADLVVLLDKLPIYCQQLNFTIKSQTIGKAATFNKVRPPMFGIISFEI